MAPPHSSRRFSQFYFHSLSLLFMLLFVTHAQCANIYAYIDDNGKLHVSNAKNDVHFKRFEPNQPITNARVTGHKTSWIASRIPSRLGLALRAKPFGDEEPGPNVPIHSKAQHYSSLISDIAKEVGVNANLLHAIIQVESAYNPKATSPKGAQGLMQLIPSTAERFGVEKSYDPAANVRGGARYIKNLLTVFDNNLQLAVAAYNAGEGAVQKYNNTIPPYPETQAYVTRVLALFKQREK